MALHKILIPVVLTQVPHSLLRQAVTLAKPTGAEIILLHVAPPHSDSSGAHTIAQARDDLEKLSLPETGSLAVLRLSRSGDPAHQIVLAAREHQVDLIMLMLDARWRIGEGWRGPRIFQRFLLHSVAAHVVESAPCAVWTLRDDLSVENFAMHRVLCFLDLSPNSRAALVSAAEIAAAADARLLLFHVTPSMEIWVPGGSRVAHMWHESFTATAQRNISRLQRDAGTNAEVLIENGGGTPAIIPALDKTKADLLVVGPLTPQSSSEVYADIYSIMRNAHLPVLISKGIAGAAPVRKQSARMETASVNTTTGARTSALVRFSVVLAILVLVIALGVGLLQVVFYTALHPTGMCSSDNPSCGQTLKPGEAGRGN